MRAGGFPWIRGPWPKRCAGSQGGTSYTPTIYVLIRSTPQPRPQYLVVGEERVPALTRAHHPNLKHKTLNSNILNPRTQTLKSGSGGKKGPNPGMRPTP